MERAVSIQDFETLASQNLPRNSYDYYRSGANGQVSLNDNVEIFKSIHLKQSLFANEKDFKGTETTILGHRVNSPICVASTAFQKMTHPDGELAMARGSNAYNRTPFMLSSWSTTPLEEVAQASPDNFKMF